MHFNSRHRLYGLAFYDTAAKVCRWKGNASDEFMEILEPADVKAMLTQMPYCKIIVTTGNKASEELLDILENLGEHKTGAGTSPMMAIPAVGSHIDVEFDARGHIARGAGSDEAGDSCNQGLRQIRWWRMPSTSRAYPLPLEAKAALYEKIF